MLDVLGADADGTVASIDAMRARVVVHRLTQLVAEHPELNQGKVVLLAEQDAAKGTAWIPTLRAYFDAFGDMADAAARVNVHPNTFRYRLRRITELSPDSPQASRARLILGEGSSASLPP